jgi:hypothetical protein
MAAVVVVSMVMMMVMVSTCLSSLHPLRRSCRQRHLSGTLKLRHLFTHSSELTSHLSCYSF